MDNKVTQTNTKVGIIGIIIGVIGILISLISLVLGFNIPIN